MLLLALSAETAKRFALLKLPISKSDQRSFMIVFYGRLSFNKKAALSV
jgi:hypothetical protein